jgi:hypothetical protein
MQWLPTRTLGVITRAIETDLIHRAGLTRKCGARSGIITLVQRFGSALNLNVHLHMIALDGVYTFDDEATRFHCVKAPTSADMQSLLDRIIRRTINQPKPFTVNQDGFSLNAAVSCLPHQRDRLDRLSTEANGRVIYELKCPFKDGTTHFVFEPLECLAKLAALIPRPRAHLTRYHGLLAPNAKYRKLVVPTPNRQAKRKRSPKCGGRLRVVATITRPDVIQKILDHVHQQQAPPRQPPHRVDGPITCEIQFDAI